MINNTVNTKNLPIFIINLEHEKEKKEMMRKQLEKFGLGHEFIRAVNGYELVDREINKKYSQTKSIEVFKRELSRGEIGCALSHLQIYKKMLDENIEKAIILEDDVTLCDEFPSIVANLDNISVPYECILLGYDDHIKKDIFLYTSFWGNKKFINEFKLYRFVKVALGTYGYIITNQGARKLYQKIDFIEKPIDHYTGNPELLSSYAVVPRCVKISDDYKHNSTIDSERKILKKAIQTVIYDTFLGIWLNRFRLFIRLYMLKMLPIQIARYWAKHVFQNRGKND